VDSDGTVCARQLEAGVSRHAQGLVFADGFVLLCTFVLLLFLNATPCCHKPLPMAVVTSVLQQCSGGLAHAHAYRIIHRDVRCENVLVTAVAPSVHVKLGDCGLPHVIESAESKVDSTVATVGEWD
jgi:serine/threonine protein kinase